MPDGARESDNVPNPTLLDLDQTCCPLEPEMAATLTDDPLFYCVALLGELSSNSYRNKSNKPGSVKMFRDTINSQLIYIPITFLQKSWVRPSLSFLCHAVFSFLRCLHRWVCNPCVHSHMNSRERNVTLISLP